MAYYSPASNKSFPPQNLASSPSIVTNNSAGHQKLPVIVKEKSPRKKTSNRSRGQPQRKVSTLSPSDASSSEALASTIASVASGGGSLEEFEKFSTATSLGSSSSSPSLFTNSLNVHPGPSSFSEQLSASQNITSSPASVKRRKNCGGISDLNSTQSNQKINQLLLTGFPDSPSNAPIGTLVDRSKKITTLSSPQFHHIQEVQQQQCRIHVQNPPQTHGDFPVTGTKIQVVHFQPSPAAASLLSSVACESPQQQPRFSPLQQQQYVSIGTMLPPPRSQQNEMIIPNHYHPNQQQTHHHSLPATPFSSTGSDIYSGGVIGTAGVVSGDMMLSSSATATPSPATAVSLSPAASMMPPTSGFAGGPKSVQNMQKLQQKFRTYQQHPTPVLDNYNGPMSVGCNNSNSYPPPSPLWAQQQQTYSNTMSAQASPQPPQHQFILQKKIEKNGCGNNGNSNATTSLLGMPSSSSYSQQQQIRQNHNQQYSPMSVPIQSVHSAEASSVPSPQILHRFHQNIPHQQIQHSSPPQILSVVGPQLHQTEHVALQPQDAFGGQNLNQQALYASQQQASLPGQQQLQPPIYHKHLQQHQIPFHNQTHQQPHQLPLRYLQTQPPPTPPQQLLRSHQQQHYLHLESTTMPIERPTAPLPTQQHLHPPPSPMYSSIKQQHNSSIGNQNASSVPSNHSIYLSQQQQSASINLKQQMPHSPLLHQQQQPIVLQKHPMQHNSFQQQPIILSPPPPPYVASNAYSSEHTPSQQIRLFPTAAQSAFVCHLTPTEPIAGCSSQMLPPMPQPARAQLSRAQLLTRHSKELKCHKYAIKLYHLQRTTKALVYKNGALADELTRLHQQIQIVTEERRVLAKRLQHHERNRIRRLQTHFRKAAAAAAAAEAAEKRNEEEAGSTTTSTTNCKKLVFSTLLNSKQKKHTTAQLNCKDSHIHTDKVSL